ncbi:cytochrome P450 family protein [Microbacterium sp. CPCC 204701]|uniref:cytochrome P450 family protein n=1 Tax=Microbacterium sp. CPCC 204701 TaxID=2493084 RepID=UPI000FDCA259|nr:cytochrome P450 [Microbacterium sp. CPCC 204701]
MSAALVPPTASFSLDTWGFEGSADPFPYYARLREYGRVVRVPRTGVDNYVITRFEDAIDALQDPRLLKDPQRMRDVFESSGVHPQQSGFVLSGSAHRHLLNTDPPDHTRLRRLVSPAFTPRRIGALRPRIQEIVDGLLDGMEKKDEPDLIQDFAYPLSITMICELLGVPAADRTGFREWSSAATTPGIASTAARDSGAAALEDYLVEHIAAKRIAMAGVSDPAQAPDVLSAMIVSQTSDDRLSDSELVGMAFLLLIAGHETTVGLIGSSALALCRRRDQRELLLADPSLMPGAVEEFLRFDGPVLRSTGRVAAEDITIAGHFIPAGSIVSMLIGGANHDPEVFADADELDITREMERHVAFGQGVHFCLGAPLARLEAQLALGTLLERFPDYDRTISDAELQYMPTVIRALASLPVALR